MQFHQESYAEDSDWTLPMMTALFRPIPLLLSWGDMGSIVRSGLTLGAIRGC